MIKWIRKQLAPYEVDPKLRAISKSAFLTNVVALALDLAVFLPLIYITGQTRPEVAHSLQQVVWYICVGMFLMDVGILIWIEVEKRRIAREKKS